MKILKKSRDDWRRRFAARGGDAAASVCVVVFFCLCFGWAIFRGHFLIGGDVLFYTYPLRTVAWEMIKSGQPPLWTPYVLSGYPLLAMSQLGLGYPLTWGHLFLPARHAEMIYILAPFLFAPAFTYAYLRELGRSRLAALLAGLSFAYGGLMTNTYGMNAIPTNALMWLPLLLIAVERARTRGFARSVVAAALPCAMSLLTGHGQSFLFVAILATAYALFLCFADDEGNAKENEPEHDGETGRMRRRAWFTWRRWLPLLSAACGMLLAVGVAAFQILETMRAARRSIRSNLSYEFFVEGSFTPRAAWLSLVAPLYHFIEVTTYVTPLAVICAACAVAFNLRRRRLPHPQQHATGMTANARAGRDARVYFWAAVALAAVWLMLGGNTPLYRALHQVPVFNLFRRPSRHVFEWTFALSVLAAYGWDALDSFSATRASGARAVVSERWKLIAAALLLLVAVALGFNWWQTAHGLPYVGDAVPDAEAAYLYWKILFTLALVAACGFALRLGATRRNWRALLLTCVVLLACFVEPHLLITHWWPGTLKTAERLTTPARATRYLQALPAHENRVYVRANSGEEEYAAAPRFDALNLTARYGLHNVAGYEALLFERYSRALGDLDYDAVNPRRGTRATLALFAPESHVLDLLNTTRVVTFSHLATTPAPEAVRAESSNRAALDAARWQTEEEFDGVVILRNARALPRAWLVGAAEAVDGEEALRRIRGESALEFDPRRTALLEVKPEELPALPGGELPRDAGARVLEYEPARLVVETRAQTATVLVVSEIIYPGWEATIDGVAARIDATDYLLRGVAVPAGTHRVEMRYRAPAARVGAIISLFSLLLLGGLIIYAKSQVPSSKSQV